MATKGLIILDTKNAILHEILQPRLLEGKKEPCEVSFGDFDDVSYRVVSPEDGSLVKINISMRVVDQLKQLGSKARIDALFPGMEVKPDEGFNFAVQINLQNITNGAELLKNLSQIKMHLLGGPLDAAFNALTSKKVTSKDVISINYRPNETMFICPSESKVVVVFLVDFADITDKAIAKIFLTQFMEAQRTIRTAPSVSFSKEPPLELANERFAYSSDCIGFLSFGLEVRHVQGERKDAAIALLTGFRGYLHYHIKCSKTYLHMRMRKNVASWLQVLNRARPEVETEKKTMGGKTFIRK